MNDLKQVCSHSFNMQGTHKMNKSKLSTYYKNVKHAFGKYIVNSFHNVC